MKKLLIIVYIIMLTATVYGQSDSVRVWNKWCARKDTPVLFMESNNLIEVYAAGVKGSDITIKSLDKKLKVSGPEVKGDTMTILAMPYITGRPMKVAISDKKTGKLIKTVAFYGDKAAVPAAHIGVAKSNEVLRKELMEYITIGTYFPNSLYSYPYKVTQYRFKTHYDKKDVNMVVDGFFLSKEVLEVIRDVPVGTVLQFTDIKATCPSCSPRSLADVNLTVK